MHLKFTTTHYHIIVYLRDFVEKYILLLFGADLGVKVSLWIIGVKMDIQPNVESMAMWVAYVFID